MNPHLTPAGRPKRKKKGVTGSRGPRKQKNPLLRTTVYTADAVYEAVEENREVLAVGAAGFGNKRKEPGGQRTSKEMQDSQLVSKFRLNYFTYAVLKLHAMQRAVYTNTLIADILTGWAQRATDFDQELFRRALDPTARIPDVPERWYGYLRSLGFDPRYQPPHPGELPPPRTAAPPTLDAEVAARDQMLAFPRDPGYEQIRRRMPVNPGLGDDVPLPLPPDERDEEYGAEYVREPVESSVMESSAQEPHPAPPAKEPEYTAEQMQGMRLGGQGARPFVPLEHRGTRPGLASGAARYSMGLPTDLASVSQPQTPEGIDPETLLPYER